MSTVGLSNKLVKTLIAACGAQLVALIVQVIATGEFDRVALAQLVGVAVTALFGFVGGYAAAPDAVAFDPSVHVPGGALPDNAKVS